MAMILSPPGQFRGTAQQQLQQCYRYLFIQNQQLNAALRTMQASQAATDSGEAADFPIDQRRTGNWHYRKWNSGFCECWGSVSGSVSVQQSSGSVYISDQCALEGMPRIFSALPLVQLTPVDSDAPYGVCAGSAGQLPVFFLISPTAQTISYRLNVYCQGAWK